MRLVKLRLSLDETETCSHELVWALDRGGDEAEIVSVVRFRSRFQFGDVVRFDASGADETMVGDAVDLVRKNEVDVHHVSTVEAVHPVQANALVNLLRRDFKLHLEAWSLTMGGRSDDSPRPLFGGLVVPRKIDVFDDARAIAAWASVKLDAVASSTLFTRVEAPTLRLAAGDELSCARDRHVLKVVR